CRSPAPALPSGKRTSKCIACVAPAARLPSTLALWKIEVSANVRPVVLFRTCTRSNQEPLVGSVPVLASFQLIVSRPPDCAAVGTPRCWTWRSGALRLEVTVVLAVLLVSGFPESARSKTWLAESTVTVIFNCPAPGAPLGKVKAYCCANVTPPARGPLTAAL